MIEDMETYKNLYLEIKVVDGGKIECNSCDGVFSTFRKAVEKEMHFGFCDRKAEEWLTSKLGNYDGWSKKDRMAVADKWIKAKELPEGRYDYYFNLQDKKEIFCEAVKKLAQGMGIDGYELAIKRHD